MLKLDRYSDTGRKGRHVSASKRADLLTSLTHPTLGLQGFKLFFKLTWEPFETQFSFIEASFLHHATAVRCLANINYQHRAQEDQNQILRYLEDQNRALGSLEDQKRILGLLEDQRRQSEYHHNSRCIFNLLIYILIY